MTKIESKWNSVPFWSLYTRTKAVGFPDEELLSVYRNYGVIRKADRDDNWNRPGEDMSQYQIVRPGDLVLNKMKTWQGALGVSPHRGIVSPAYFVYSSRSENDGRFLHYALRSKAYVDYYAAISKGVRPNQWDLQPELLDQMRVHLPADVAHQRRIADYLDRETAEIDTMVDRLDRLHGLLLERKTHEIETSIVGPLRPLWTVCRDVIDCPHTTPHPDEAGEAEAVRTASVRNGRFIPGKGIPVSRETALQRNREATPSEGDIFFTREAPAGEACLVPSAGNFCLGQRMVLIRPDLSTCNPGYLVYALHTRAVQDSFVHAAGGSTVVNLKLGTIRGTRIPVPPLDEQRRIAQRLDRETAEIDSMMVDAKRLKVLLAERRSNLITEVVMGRKEVA